METFNAMQEVLNYNKPIRVEYNGYNIQYEPKAFMSMVIVTGNLNGFWVLDDAPRMFVLALADAIVGEGK